MKRTKSILTVLAITFFATATEAKTEIKREAFLPFSYRQTDMQQKMTQLSEHRAARNNGGKIRKSSINPTYSFEHVRNFYDIDSPDGKIWFCATQLDCSYIEHEAYTEAVLQEYSFSIFDENFNLIGSIHDKMRYEEDEVRVPGPDNGIALLPIVTKHFFNSDDKYEVAVSLCINTNKEGQNRYRTVVYSIDGDKETVEIERHGNTVDVEVDKPIKVLDGFVSDILNLSKPEDEQVYLTFEEDCGEVFELDFDKIIEGDEEECQKYWHALSTSGICYSMYAKADIDGNLEKVFEKEVTYQTMQGDQENSPVMFTIEGSDNSHYIIFPHYKETFFNPFYSPFEDMTMREENSLVIEMYLLEGAHTTPFKTVEIPVLKGEGDTVLATYYSVGDLLHASDVRINDSRQPNFIVTRCNYTTANDETSGYCYYLYDEEGNRITTIFEDAESTMVLSDAGSSSPQALFVTYDDEEGYIYNIVNILNPKPEETIKINYLLEQDDDYNVLGFNADRVRVGDEPQYAFELRRPYEDDLGNTWMQVAWFNSNGSFDRVDRVNMGQNVNYATVYIDALVLDPMFICPDELHEYMILIKRSISDTDSAAQEEFLIAQPSDPDKAAEGKVFLELGPCDKGVLRLIDIYPGIEDESYRLMIAYTDEAGVSADFYELPFEYSAISSPVVSDNAEPSLSFANGKLKSEGMIWIYTVTGAEVARCSGEIDASLLPKGVYVARSGESSCKFFVK